MSNVIIVVKGGMVQAVYSDSKETGVEVLDLDEPAFLTEEERKEFDAMEKRVEEMQNDPGWFPAW